MSEWISVKDRLPDSPERVIGSINQGSRGKWVDFVMYDTTEQWCSYNEWFDCEETGDKPEVLNVTHWQPVPEYAGDEP